MPVDVHPARSARTHYRIDVKDNGIGFDAKYVEWISQVFQRLHGKNDCAGTGISLAICQRVAANHGWVILAYSQPGQRATGSAYFPASSYVMYIIAPEQTDCGLPGWARPF